MKLTHGSYYKTDSGEVVFCQLESDGCFGVYNAGGTEVLRQPKYQTVEQDETGEDGKVVTTEIEVESHVEGWTPCGAAPFKEARDKIKGRKPEPKAATKGKNKGKGTDVDVEDASTDESA